MNYIFTDGSSHRNGYLDCTSGFGVYFDNALYDSISRPTHVQPSNQRAELEAILFALETISHDTRLFTIVTDSRYSLDCIQTWSKNWRRNGWKTTKGDPVKHSDIIKRILESLAGKETSFLHINSHKPRPFDETTLEYTLWHGNDKADKLAKASLHRETSI